MENIANYPSGIDLSTDALGRLFVQLGTGLTGFNFLVGYRGQMVKYSRKIDPGGFGKHAVDSR